MQITLPIILIALGGILLITQRDRRLVLLALLVQWVGLAWQLQPLLAGTPGLPVEIVTALACSAILGITVWNINRAGTSTPTATQPSNTRQFAIADQLWLWAIALVVGVAGYGLARIYPLGGSEQDLVAFYWIALPALLALVIDGSREPVRLGAGILSLANAALLLVYALAATSPGTLLLALSALLRIALAAASGYTWLFLRTTYHDLNLNTLFDMRDGKIAGETALALVEMQSIGITESTDIIETDQIEPTETEEATSDE
ncbi:MAG: hypothetical protein ABI670_13245 [Chloroflexota bacterium]